jgi:hypothetical protein
VHQQAAMPETGPLASHVHGPANVDRDTQPPPCLGFRSAGRIADEPKRNPAIPRILTHSLVTSIPLLPQSHYMGVGRGSRASGCVVFWAGA